MHLPPLYVYISFPLTELETLFTTSGCWVCLEQTSGCSGAELTVMCQEAAIIAMREDLNTTFVGAPPFSVAP
jgi:hypothetical protein